MDFRSKRFWAFLATNMGIFAIVAILFFQYNAIYYLVSIGIVLCVALAAFTATAFQWNSHRLIHRNPIFACFFGFIVSTILWFLVLWITGFLLRSSFIVGLGVFVAPIFGLLSSSLMAAFGVYPKYDDKPL